MFNLALPGIFGAGTLLVIFVAYALLGAPSPVHHQIIVALPCNVLNQTATATYIGIKP